MLAVTADTVSRIPLVIRAVLSASQLLWLLKVHLTVGTFKFSLLLGA
jgi:hypothetical protein